MNGYIVIVYDEKGERSWDAICHDGSYGHELGLLEVMGERVVRVTDDAVEGYLTAEEVIGRLGKRMICGMFKANVEHV